MYFGKCKCCGSELEPVWFIEEEEIYDSGVKSYYKTGRKRKNINYLECPECWHKEAVDDSFAEEWR
jgi:hypothetical protein